MSMKLLRTKTPCVTVSPSPTLPENFAIQVNWVTQQTLGFVFRGLLLKCTCCPPSQIPLRQGFCLVYLHIPSCGNVESDLYVLNEECITKWVEEESECASKPLLKLLSR